MDNPTEVKQNTSGQPEKLPFQVNLFYWVQALVSALVVMVIIFSVFLRIVVVSGSSMEKTLHHGNLVIVREVGYTPKQGDIVVVNKMSATYLNGGEQEAIIKRVIATEGQHVVVDYTANTVSVDGEVLDEPYVWEEMIDFSVFSSNYSNLDVVVPENCVYVLGDNRNNSTDSRDIRLGAIDEQYVIGKAVLVLFPISNFEWIG